MEVESKKHKRSSSIFKKLESYLSLSRRLNPSARPTDMFASKNNNKANAKRQVAPTGCFSVYVGPEKQRFVIKTEYANHPLFKMLLEDAELEYGFQNDGPIVLPCEVDLFCKVLAEMDLCKDNDDYPPCGFAYGSCSPFNPARRLGRSSMAKGCTSYGLLTPPRLLKINNY
ncbi:hypothetical protein Salat_0017500 [Sesamum alatum]|uniref:Uncharacterized protein n=1 Tax=Sesamum alatum TaxID=300844 RepID=A0AAE2CW58_9LAMI|nr:hypothetical protein Salat_0017500 [Sesamum alatum]